MNNNKGKKNLKTALFKNFVQKNARTPGVKTLKNIELHT